MNTCRVVSGGQINTVDTGHGTSAELQQSHLGSVNGVPTNVRN